MKKKGIQIKDENGCEIYPNPFPVGAIYMSVDSRNPSQIFGGTWEQIKDKFLLCAGTTYKPGTTGGSAYLQAHTHSWGGTTSSNGTHRHAFTYNQINSVGTNSYAHATGGYGNQYTDQQLGFCNIAESGEHNHTISGTTSDHNKASGNAGNMPPYLAVYVWRRVS